MSARQPIRTLDDLKARCEVDEQTGCWVWTGSRDANGHPKPYIINPSNGQGAQMSGARALLLLTGQPVVDGHAYVRVATCTNEACVSPEHRTRLESRGEAMRLQALKREQAKRSRPLDGLEGCPEHVRAYVPRPASQRRYSW